MSKATQESGGNKNEDPRLALARELWERLGKSRPGPSIENLIFIARFVPLLSMAAIKTLLTRSLTVSELKELVQHVPRAKEVATKKLLELPPEQLTEDDLKFVFTETRHPEVGKVLLKRFPSNGNLGLAERTTDDLKELIDKLRVQETTSVVLREIDRRL
jgi:hypothetical protein